MNKNDYFLLAKYTRGAEFLAIISGFTKNEILSASDHAGGSGLRMLCPHCFVQICISSLVVLP